MTKKIIFPSLIMILFWCRRSVLMTGRLRLDQPLPKAVLTGSSTQTRIPRNSVGRSRLSGPTIPKPRTAATKAPGMRSRRRIEVKQNRLLRMKICVFEPTPKTPRILCVFVVKGFTAKTIHSILNKYNSKAGVVYESVCALAAKSSTCAKHFLLKAFTACHEFHTHSLCPTHQPR
jgi:hypothetical protein